MTDAFAPCAAYLRMLPERQLISNLLGGTPAMQAAAAQYLVREEAESEQSWIARVARSYLFNQFDRTVRASVGRVLSKPLNFRDIPAAMEPWIEDADLEGSHLDQWVRPVFMDALAMGVSFAMIDAPKSDKPLDQRTLLDDRLEGTRPYLIHVPALNVISWRFQNRTLTQVRIRENTVVPDGDFGEKNVERVRVLSIGRYDVYERGIDVPVESGETGLDFIPFVAIYANKIDRFVATSPLANLASLNLRHFQSTSEQCTALRTARIPILVKTSIARDEDNSDELVLGAGAAFDLAPGEDLRWVGSDGSAIAAGRQDLLDLQEQMEKAGFQMTARATGSADVTATETTVTAAESHAALQAMALNLQDALEVILRMMAVIGGIDAEPSVVVSKDFGTINNAVDVPLLLQLRAAGEISSSTLLHETQRRGLIAEDVQIDAEIAATAADKAALVTAAAAPAAPIQD